MFPKIVKLSSLLLVFIFVLRLVSSAIADVQSGWLATGDAQVAKINDLPANVFPGLSNRDCNKLTYVTVTKQAASDCFVTATYGSMPLAGSPFMPNGTSAALPLIPFNSNSSLQPIPNQGMTMVQNYAPLFGAYLEFYTNITAHFQKNYELGVGVLPHLVSYTVKDPSDFSLTDKNNKRMAVNASGTLSYSSNGSWMVVDYPGRGFVRVSLSSFDVLPFAPSLSDPSDFSSRSALTSISDDGRYAAVASDNFSYFKVYDLDTCTGTTNNDYSQLMDCSYHDYWPAMASKLDSFGSIAAVRFINDDNLRVTASYNRANASNFSVANFRLTAPGKKASSLDYLALGDSYVSGQGEFVYKDGTDTKNNPCHLSPLSYPFAVGSGLFNSYQSIACSGAVTLDVTNLDVEYRGQVRDRIMRKYRDSAGILQSYSPGYIAQIEFVQKYQPKVVTLSAGGNNIGFAGMLTSCVKPDASSVVAYWNTATCYDTYDERMQVVQAIGSLYATLQYTYATIMSDDPGVELYVTGYPQVLALGNCAQNVHLSSAEIQFSQNVIAYLDWTIERAALSTGARYVDVQNAFNGSRLCETKSSAVAVNGITVGNDNSFIGNESFHPNVFGHQLLARAVLGKTGNFTQAMPTADPSLSRPNATDELALAILGNLPYSGNSIPQYSAAQQMLSAGIVRGMSATLTLDGQQSGLKPNTSYQVILRPGNSAIATVTTDASGNLSAPVTIPAATLPGFYTAHVLGANMADQTTDLYTTVYVEASADDYDGDGVPNSQNSCGIVPLSGQDADQDGIDDACDPYISDPPKDNYSYRATLTNNSITTTRP